MIGEWTPRQLQAFVERIIQQQGGPSSHFESLEVEDLIINDQLQLSSPAAQSIGEGLRSPAVRVYASTTAAVVPSTWTTISWDTRSHDTTIDRMWNSTATDRIIIPFEGTYAVTAHVNWPSGATGDKFIRLTGNWGTTAIRAAAQSSSGEHGPQIFDMLRFAVNDYIQVQVYHVNGANLTPVNNANMFAVTRIG